jgi:predicted RNA binding protein YcfA (HicA-like mRNA interferase family)
MKEASEVFKSIRYAKLAPKGKPHKSTDDEEHGTVGEKEYEDQVKHVKKMSGAIAEEKKDKYDEGEYDREGDMAKSDLRSIIANAQKLHDMIDDADNLPEWVQSKITIAEDYISTVANYMTAEVNEEVEYLEEKNAPTNPALWSRAKALARSKFDVYPSAYANGWASKWYKSKGGGWKSVSEEVEQIDELSKDTLTSYATKAGKSLGGAVATIGNAKEISKFYAKKTSPKEVKNDAIHRAGKRMFGLGRAASRLAKEEVEQLEEMPGANMDTRAVHQHLKKKGWSLSRTSGSHDVFTHPEAKHHIPVPRHRQLKAPLVKGILKQAEVREEVESGTFTKVNESRAKDIAKLAARRNAGIKEQSEPEDSLEKNDTPAKRSLSKAAGMVKDLAKNAKATKKEKPDTFQPEPELSSQIVKV